MATIKLDLSGVGKKIRDFLEDLMGPRIFVYEKGGKTMEFNSKEELEAYRKSKKAEPTPTPTATPTPTPRPKADLSGFRATTVPKDFSEAITSASEKFDVDPSLLAAGIFQESSFDPRAVNTGTTKEGRKFKARGSAQIVDIFHPEVSDEQAFDPGFATNFYAEEFDKHRKKFGGDINRALAAYNVGPGGAAVEGPGPFGGGPQGQTYINDVARHLSYDLIKDLGIKISPSLLKEYGL